MVDIGIDKPFGELVQRSYDFDYSIIPASRISVTPFSGILADPQAQERHRDVDLADWLTDRALRENLASR